MAKSKARAHREPLTRASILDAAIDLADSEGLGSMSMRNLARSLGFEVMALYNHVANKDELFSLMVDAVAAEIESPSSDLEPLKAVRSITLSTRAALVAHPWASELWLKHLPGPARSASMENLLMTLAESGLSDELAHHGFHAVNNHVLGYTIQEQGMTLGQEAETAEDTIHEYLASLSEEVHPHAIAHVHQHLNGKTTSSFELVLDLILDGLVRFNEDSE